MQKKTYVFKKRPRREDVGEPIIGWDAIQPLGEVTELTFADASDFSRRLAEMYGEEVRANEKGSLQGRYYMPTIRNNAPVGMIVTGDRFFDEDVLKAVEEGILTDEQLKIALQHYKILCKVLKVHGEVYRLVWLDAYHKLLRLEDMQKARKEKR